jgi:hypothetical protein
LLERLALRMALTQQCIADPQWDFILSVVAETHCICHRCWDSNQAEQVFAAADEALGALVDNTSPDTTVVVFSVLGMGPNDSGNHLLGEILERLDPQGQTTSAEAPDMRAASAEAAISRLRAQLLGSRRFFAVVTDMPTAGVRLNLVGREPHGVVEPADYDRTLRELETDLHALRDDEDGQPAVEDVIRTADAYPGPYSDAFADLLVVWRAKPLRAVHSDRTGFVHFEPPPARNGNHLPGGWFIAAGPRAGDLALPNPAPLVDFTAAVRSLALP